MWKLFWLVNFWFFVGWKCVNTKCKLEIGSKIFQTTTDLKESGKTIMKTKKKQFADSWIHKKQIIAE